MTNTELKEALLNKKPVLLTLNDGAEIKCKYVYGITYREKNGKILVQAEVIDENGRCQYNCDPKQIRYEV
jgi:hypothetical protein